MAPRRKAPAAAAGEQQTQQAATVGYLLYRASDRTPVTLYRREQPAAVAAFRGGFGMTKVRDGEFLEDAINRAENERGNGAGPAADTSSSAAGGGKPAAAESSPAG